jgi:hypothetical protein
MIFDFRMDENCTFSEVRESSGCVEGLRKGSAFKRNILGTVLGCLGVE